MLRVLQRLAVWLAFGAALLAPAVARAALIPACDGYDILTRMPAPTPLPEPTLLDGACTAPGGVADGGVPEDGGDLRIAAMCDDRGASVVAPQRILPIGDARIDIAPDEGRSSQVMAPGPERSPLAGASVALAEHAVLDALSPIAPASWELCPSYPPVTGGPRVGFARGIDHPPR